jgi:hypothetical protein
LFAVNPDQADGADADLIVNPLVLIFSVVGGVAVVERRRQGTSSPLNAFGSFPPIPRGIPWELYQFSIIAQAKGYVNGITAIGLDENYDPA